MLQAGMSRWGQEMRRWEEKRNVGLTAECQPMVLVLRGDERATRLKLNN